LCVVALTWFGKQLKQQQQAVLSQQIIYCYPVLMQGGGV